MLNQDGPPFKKKSLHEHSTSNFRPTFSAATSSLPVLSLLYAFFAISLEDFYLPKLFHKINPFFYIRNFKIKKFGHTLYNPTLDGWAGEVRRE